MYEKVQPKIKRSLCKCPSWSIFSTELQNQNCKPVTSRSWELERKGVGNRLKRLRTDLMVKRESKEAKLS